MSEAQSPSAESTRHTVRLATRTVERVDDLVDAGEADSRSAVIRQSCRNALVTGSLPGPGRLPEDFRARVTVRVPAQLEEDLEALLADSPYGSLSAVVRAALHQHLGMLDADWLVDDDWSAGARQQRREQLRERYPNAFTSASGDPDE